MVLSPLKIPSGSGYSSRRRSSPWTRVIQVALGLAALGLVYYIFFGFSARLNGAFKDLKTGKVDKAAAEFRQLSAAEPAQAGPWDGLGMVANSKEDSAQAQDCFKKALDLGLKYSQARRHEEAGRAYVSRLRYGQALLEYRQAAQINPDSSRSQLGVGYCALASGDFSSAVDAFQKSLGLEPSLEEARKGLEKATTAKERGTIYYLFDRNNQPLARQALQADGTWVKSYPEAQYAAGVVGYDNATYGKVGLEKSLASLFPGNEVVLTIDKNIQRIADRALGWKKGCLVVLDPNTGEILAAVNHPSYNPNNVEKDYKKYERHPNHPLINRAFEGLYEPGSICKIITAAAALETHVDMTKIFPVNSNGSMMLDGKVFLDWKKLGKIRSLKDALDESSNIALAQVGFALGSDRLHEYTIRFGFSAPEDIGFQLASGEKMSVNSAMSTAPIAQDTRFALAERACGLGKDYRITPLHAAVMVSVVANKGVLMRPTLIKEVRNAAGEVVFTTKPQKVREVIRPDTAEKLKDYMVETVEKGIGSKAKVSGVKVAGKTGTARTSKKGLDAWFICFAPADKPQYAIAVLAEAEGTGMHVAAPIARMVLEDLIK